MHKHYQLRVLKYEVFLPNLNAQNLLLLSVVVVLAQSASGQQSLNDWCKSRLQFASEQLTKKDNQFSTYDAFLISSNESASQFLQKLRETHRLLAEEGHQISKENSLNPMLEEMRNSFEAIDGRVRSPNDRISNREAEFLRLKSLFFGESITSTGSTPLGNYNGQWSFKNGQWVSEVRITHELLVADIEVKVRPWFSGSTVLSFERDASYQIYQIIVTTIKLKNSPLASAEIAGTEIRSPFTNHYQGFTPVMDNDRYNLSRLSDPQITASQLIVTSLFDKWIENTYGLVSTDQIELKSFVGCRKTLHPLR